MVKNAGMLSHEGPRGIKVVMLTVLFAINVDHSVNCIITIACSIRKLCSYYGILSNVIFHCVQFVVISSCLDDMTGCMRYRGVCFIRVPLLCLLTNTGVDEDVVKVVEGVADAVENQVEAGRDATVTDRLKMAGIYSYTFTENIRFGSS